MSNVVWVIGNKGMLGTEFSLRLKKAGAGFVGTDRDVDITSTAALEAFAEKQTAPVGWIVNCAAYTAVDKAEDDVETCRQLNVLGPANIASCAKKIGARLIHISTDYVFDGKGIAGEDGPRPYREDDYTDPIGVYGLTKRNGELAVLENNPRSYIIRTAWLYGKHGNNFVRTMIKLMNEREEIKVVNDQKGSPTWAFDLAEVLLEMVKPGRAEGNPSYGIYHYTNEGEISWFDFAREIYARGRKRGLVAKDCLVKPCTSAEYPAKVTRPAFSVLDKTKIKTALGIDIPSWNSSLEGFLETLAGESWA